MKEKILTLLNEMTNDSKSVSWEAEKELCAILTGVITKLRTIEETVGWSVREYPDKIWCVENWGWYNKLPKEIDCHKGDFIFKTEWLDINLQEYFEELKECKISAIKKYITQTEHSLNKYKEDLGHIEELKFEDLWRH